MDRTLVIVCTPLMIFFIPLLVCRNRSSQHSSAPEERHNLAQGIESWEKIPQGTRSPGRAKEFSVEPSFAPPGLSAYRPIATHGLEAVKKSPVTIFVAAGFS